LECGLSDAAIEGVLEFDLPTLFQRKSQESQSQRYQHH
jgi:hypothetical protein